jgi:hypothetical protein
MGLETGGCQGHFCDDIVTLEVFYDGVQGGMLRKNE